MKRKTYLLATIVFFIGIIMLFGTSYSLITNNLTSKETYGFNVANFDVEFLDNTKITISGIPTDDEDGLKNGKEITFSVNNNSDYDVNYRLDIIENGNTNMSKFIHYAYSINDSSYSEIFNLGDNYTVKQNQILRVNSTDKYKIKIWLSIDADESFMNKSFSASISLTATQNEYKYATNVIEKLESMNLDGVKKDGNNYRYSTSKSLNYVWFNCQDGFTKGLNYCEKWRIIGSFYNHKRDTSEMYHMLKIISIDSPDIISYNNDEKNGSYDNSYIESYANGFYYDKLNEQAKDLILEAQWNIGDVKSNTYQEAIKEESSKIHFSNVGLLNVSDYLYLQSESFFNNNILLLNKNNNQVNILNNTISIGKNTESYNFLPCVYLRPDVSIVSGNGSVDSPYELSIKYSMNY